MTEEARQIITNSMAEIQNRFGVKATLLICFEDGERTILVAGKTDELCDAAKTLGQELQDGWIQNAQDLELMRKIPIRDRFHTPDDFVLIPNVPDILN